MLSLNEREWKEFKIGSIFSVSGTTTTPPADLVLGGKTPRITCSSTQNGLDNMYINPPTENGGVLTVDSATVGSITYQHSSFIATDHVEKIAFEQKTIDRFTAMFLITNINKAKAHKYDYGYKFCQTRIKKQTLMLPVDSNGLPDYDFMEAYIIQQQKQKILEYTHFCLQQLSELGNYETLQSISKKEWHEFFVDDIFSIGSGKRLESYNMIAGNRPFIGATDSGNGVTNYISNENESLDSNVLGVNYNGNGMVISFYHPYECLFSDDVKRFHLRNHPDNKYVLLFFKTLILQQKAKYNYGYKFNATRMKRQKIMLPVTETGEPDYDYMEQYAKNIMIRKYQQYLDYLGKRRYLCEY